MRYRTAQLGNRPALSTKRFILDRFLGVDFTQGDFITDYRRSPDAKNLVWGNNQYIPKTRYGFRPVGNFKLDGKINGIHFYYGEDGAGTMLVHVGNKLYKMAIGENGDHFQECGFDIELSDTKSTSFMFEAALYIIGCGVYLVFDGKELKTASSVAHVPTVTVGRNPKDGGGVSLEEINLLTRKMRYSFAIQEKEESKALPAGSADADPAGGTDSDGKRRFDIGVVDYRDLEVTISVLNKDGEEYYRRAVGDWEADETGNIIAIPGHNFKVNEGFYTGNVNFTYLIFDAASEFLLEPGAEVVSVNVDGEAIPMPDGGWTVSSEGYVNIGRSVCGVRGAEGEDNVLIEFVKPYEDEENKPEDKINGCSVYDLYGGANDSRVFLSGNPKAKNCDWCSGVYDATYFPERGYTYVGSANVAIMGYVKQFDTQIIIKESNQEDGSCFLRRMDYEANGTAFFPIEQGVVGTGATCGRTFGFLNGEPLFLSDLGVVGVVGTDVDYHNLIQVRSTLINKRLLRHRLATACSVVCDNKYYLFVGGEVFIADARMMYKDEFGRAEYEWMYWAKTESGGLDIIAESVATDGKTIYFGGAGHIYRFKTSADKNPYLDEKDEKTSAAVISYWTTPKLFFDTVSEKKTIYDLVAFFDNAERVHTNVSAIIDGKELDLGTFERGDILDWRCVDFTRFVFEPLTQYNADNIKANLRGFICVKFLIATRPTNEAPSLAFGLQMLQADYIYTR